VSAIAASCLKRVHPGAVSGIGMNEWLGPMGGRNSGQTVLSPDRQPPGRLRPNAVRVSVFRNLFTISV